MRLREHVCARARACVCVNQAHLPTALPPPPIPHPPFPTRTQDRVDFIETTPNVTRLQHLRIVAFMAFLLVRLLARRSEGFWRGGDVASACVCGILGSLLVHLHAA